MAPEPLESMSEEALESHQKKVSALLKKKKDEHMKKAIEAVEKLLKKDFQDITLQKIIEYKRQEEFVAAVEAAEE